MSGRTRHWRNGELITNRKTDRRNPRRASAAASPAEAKRLIFPLPPSLSCFVSPGPTGVTGVTVQPDHRVEVKGLERSWLFRQARAFLASISKGHGEVSVIATLEMPARSHHRVIFTIGDPVVAKPLIFPR
jgi:hypothetical protein